MSMTRIARTNRLPDSLPVVLKLLQERPEGLTISDMEQLIEARQLWSMEGHSAPRALYHRVYGVLKLLANKSIVRQVQSPGRDTLWVLDADAFAQQQRKELFWVVQPFVDGCMMTSDPKQLVEQLQELIDEGTLDVMLAERRSKGRQGR